MYKSTLLKCLIFFFAIAHGAICFGQVVLAETYPTETTHKRRDRYVGDIAGKHIYLSRLCLFPWDYKRAGSAEGLKSAYGDEELIMYDKEMKLVARYPLSIPKNIPIHSLGGIWAAGFVWNERIHLFKNMVHKDGDPEDKRDLVYEKYTPDGKLEKRETLGQVSEGLLLAETSEDNSVVAFADLDHLYVFDLESHKFKSTALGEKGIASMAVSNAGVVYAVTRPLRKTRKNENPTISLRSIDFTSFIGSDDFKNELCQISPGGEVQWKANDGGKTWDCVSGVVRYQEMNNEVVFGFIKHQKNSDRIVGVALKYGKEINSLTYKEHDFSKADAPDLCLPHLKGKRDHPTNLIIGDIHYQGNGKALMALEVVFVNATTKLGNDIVDPYMCYSASRSGANASDRRFGNIGIVEFSGETSKVLARMNRDYSDYHFEWSMAAGKFCPGNVGMYYVYWNSTFHPTKLAKAQKIDLLAMNLKTQEKKTVVTVTAGKKETVGGEPIEVHKRSHTAHFVTHYLKGNGITYIKARTPGKITLE